MTGEQGNVEKTAEERAAEELAAREQDRLSIPRFAEQLSEASGWPQDKAVETLETALEMGIKPKTFVARGYWRIPMEKFPEAHSGGEGKKRCRIAREVAERSGKKRSDIEAQMIEARYEKGVRYEYFRNYHWDELTDEQKETVFLRPHGRMMSQKYRKPHAKSNMLNDKSKFYKEFADHIGRKWFLFVPGKTSFEEFCEKLDKFSTDTIIYKPQGLSGGVGIKKFELSAPKQEIFDEMMGQGEALIEECVHNHPDMDKLCPDSVNTVRIVSLTWGDDNPEPKLLYAGARFGRGNGSAVDSVRQGGMSVAVDLETGCICTFAVTKADEIFETHPVTGTKFEGFQIPFWPETLQMVRESAKKALEVAGLGYVGWDVAITPTGPIIIEANNWPSPSLAQLPYWEFNRTGLRPLVDGYLWD